MLVDKPWPELTRQEAKAYLAQFVAEQPQRIDQLRRLSEATGGPTAEELDLGPDSLVALWRWARQRLSWNEGYEPPRDAGWPASRRPGPEDLPPLAELPSWAGGDIRDAAEFSPDTLWLIDMVARYFAEVARRGHPAAQWRAGHSRIRATPSRTARC
ncbi:MAG TPA: hypothetical protein VG452_03535 [Egibacteraceae bacterium]|nr:hypothetical protein [Egibacteraceae bacterium]